MGIEKFRLENLNFNLELLQPILVPAPIYQTLKILQTLSTNILCHYYVDPREVSTIIVTAFLLARKMVTKNICRIFAESLWFEASPFL